MSIHSHHKFFLTNSSFGDVFKKASRHSRCISILKIFLPLCALILALVFCWFTFFFIPSTSDSLILKNEEEGGTKLTMLHPKLEGYTRSHNPYWLKAEKAFQDRTHAGVIGLQNITAEALIGKQRRVLLDARGGIYNNINGSLQLDKPFKITTNDGMTAQFMAANIDLSKGQLSTNQPVNIQHAGLYLAANALQIREKGEKMYFHGGVHLVIDNK
ncbi:LPS export ABC transporter periplasmic protein LptC [Bartonella raoultii]|uniref:LPS export ABC transporter periplasmic protein LptC n=1 Tax=Bartonella raoultii TaxID=1457020 RepID=A0ABS7I819_9HYPH|nr:LPS export ABC transporter periplasmic protein LptC [Bartonella raoultii]MBX4335286.1 LPS export ABC transporter periplasmic protein LptC [Bartonella raoultii]